MGDNARPMPSEVMWSDHVVSPEPGGRHRPELLNVTRDTYPLFRVDLTELFGRFLSREFRLTWLMDRSDVGDEPSVHRIANQVFLLPRRLQREGAFVNAFRSLLFKLAVASHVLRRRWRVVQVRDAALHATFFLIAAKLARVRFAYWMSFPIAEGFVAMAKDRALVTPVPKRVFQYLYGRLSELLLYSLVIPNSDHVFVQSEKMREFVTARGGDAPRITPVPMGVSMHAYRPDDILPMPIIGDARSLLYMGAVEQNRRVDVLVEALQLLVKDGRALHMYILAIGSDADIAHLRRTIARCGMEANVTLLPRQPLQTALRWVRSADVCLSPCPDDPLLRLGTPTKLIEYLAMERPVVASPHPDQCEVIEGSGAGLVAELEPHAFAKAIAVILDDPSWSQRAKNGRAWVERHRSYEALSSLVADVYRGMIYAEAPR